MVSHNSVILNYFNTNKTLILEQIFYKEEMKSRKKEDDSMKINHMETQEKYRVDTNMSRDKDQSSKVYFTFFKNVKTGLMNNDNKSTKIGNIPEENHDEILESYKMSHRDRIENFPRKVKKEK